MYNHSINKTYYNEKPTTTINYLCTDGHHAYNKVYERYKHHIKHHIVGKSETYLVESFNSSMRDRLVRLKRKRVKHI
jgi:IS1 family transposase